MAGVMGRGLVAALMWSGSLAAALGAGPEAAVIAAGADSCESARASATRSGSQPGAAPVRAAGPARATGADQTGDLRSERAAARACGDGDPAASGAHDREPIQLAQFQLPKRKPQGTAKDAFSPRYPYRPLTQALTYEYAIGTESEADYLRNQDLNSRVQDNLLLVIPQVNGFIIYRPVNWLSTTLEIILEKEFSVQEPGQVTLPSGETQYAPTRQPSLLVDQAFVTIKDVIAPFEFHAGRRNYEDERHWLYDTSLDIGSVGLRLGHVHVEATAGRQVAWDLDFLRNDPKDRINTYMLYAAYRGIEDLRLAAYTIKRNDLTNAEGRPLFIGMRALGTPADAFNYWAELAFVRGKDESSRRFSAYGFDVGFTYRFAMPSLSPSITLGYAFGTGDANPDDGRNREFRQTGLQSNEEKFAGVAKFKYYGEMVDPELSNLKIFTLGVGFRPARNVTVDLVYHRYRLHKMAEELRNSNLTALMNQDETRPSKDVGSAFDIVIGFRRLFGIRRLGVDLRAGWFFPGDAFRVAEGDPSDPTFRRADKGVGVVVKLWY